MGEQCLIQPRRVCFSVSLFSTAYLRFTVYTHIYHPGQPIISVNNEEG